VESLSGEWVVVAAYVHWHIYQLALSVLVCQVEQATATPESGFGSSGPFTSTLSATADPVLDGTLVECFGPAATVDLGNRVGNSTIQIVGQ